MIWFTWFNGRRLGPFATLADATKARRIEEHDWNEYLKDQRK